MPKNNRRTTETKQRNYAYRANLRVNFKRQADKSWCPFLANKKWSEQNYIDHLRYFNENSYLFDRYIIALFKDAKPIKMIKFINGKATARKVTKKDANRIRLHREALGGQQQTVNE